ncbi:hypothetical protein [Shinella granuli]|uniref:hypothetical protein n=1 Tax=Shinella granuli TaxID=323621 RepID=UPI001054FF41|nr:hypothetical protein [Shinella granuli]
MAKAQKRVEGRTARVFIGMMFNILVMQAFVVPQTRNYPQLPWPISAPPLYTYTFSLRDHPFVQCHPCTLSEQHHCQVELLACRTCGASMVLLASSIPIMHFAFLDHRVASAQPIQHPSVEGASARLIEPGGTQ